MLIAKAMPRTHGSITPISSIKLGWFHLIVIAYRVLVLLLLVHGVAATLMLLSVTLVAIMLAGLWILI